MAVILGTGVGITPIGQLQIMMKEAVNRHQVNFVMNVRLRIATAIVENRSRYKSEIR